MNTDRLTIVGIDCATDPRSVGLALGVLDAGQLHISQTELGSSSPEIATRIAEWLSPITPALIALDAPLGWPEPLGRTLTTHQAGNPVTEEANLLFRRATDRYIKAQTGKQPLDVGADRIARTAVAALTLLDRIRAATGQEIPLAWSPDVTTLSAIEVYPAGTLTAHGLPNQSYKRNQPDHRQVREQILKSLRNWVTVENATPLLENADILDAALCCVAGADFLRGHCAPPEDQALAHREGWIWVRHLQS